MNRGIKIAIVALAGLLVMIVGLVAFFTISAYVERQREAAALAHEITAQRQAIQRSVAENTEAVRILLSYEVKGQGITYKELFDRGEDRLKKLADATLPVASSKLPEGEKAALKAYMEGLQEVLRLQADANHKEVAAAAAGNTATDAYNEWRSSGEYTADYALSRARDALSTSESALADLRAAYKDFRSALIEFRKTVNANRPLLTQYSLVDDQLIGQVIDKYDVDKPKQDSN